MKQKLLTIKSLLVAVLLLGGANFAWSAEGDEIYSNDFSTNSQTDFATWIGTGIVPSGYTNTQIGRNGAFSIATGALVHTAPNGRASSNVYDADFGTFNEAITTATASTNYVLSFDITLAITNHIACTSIFEISGEDKKTIICLYADHTRTNKTTGATTYGYIVGGNNAFATKDATISTKTNSEGSIGDGTKHVIAGPISGMTGSKTYHVIFDAQTVGAAKLTIKEGETTIVDKESVSISADNGLKWIYFSNYNSWETESSQITIDNLSIVEGAASGASAGYTVNYKLSEETVKTVSSTNLVGATITADVAIDGEGTYAGNHYLITDVDAPSMTLVADAASNVLNVPVRAPYTATLNVTKTIGGVAETPVVTNLIETDGKVCSWTYTYPMYVQKDGVYYVADETASFGESGNFTDGQTINKTVAYTNPDYSVVYYAEPNEVAGTNTAYSNGSTGYIKGGVVYSSDQVIRLGQLTAGTYHLITNVTGDAGRNVVVGDYTAGTESFPTALVTITTTGAKDETFTVDGTQLICISGKDQGSGKFNQSATIDYILVKASTQEKTIPTTGYTTFASPYALNLSGMTASTGDANAYYVTASDVKGSSVALTEATGNVAAGTGLILNGTAGASITIPVVASGTALSGNKLVGCTTPTDITSATENYGNFYVLSATEAAFKKIKNWVDAPNTLTIPAGKAYLDTTGANVVGAPTLTFDLGGVTAITNTNCTNNTNIREVYNLNGQRVAQPTKGLYIVNGKKIIIK